MNEIEKTTTYDIIQAVQKMTLSASGWRGVFNIEKDEQSVSKILAPEFAFISYFAAISFYNFLSKYYPNTKEIILARDARPTGENIEKIVYVAFREHEKEKKQGMKIRSIGIAPIPEVISYSASRNSAFFYISASHNPIGYNGFKFGVKGVLEKKEALEVMWGFRGILLFGKDGMDEQKSENQVMGVYAHTAVAPPESFLIPLKKHIKDALNLPLEKIEIKKAKEEAFKAYKNHIKIVASGRKSLIEANDFFNLLKAEINIFSPIRPIYIACDFNGSARAKSIDLKLLKQLGIKFIPFHNEAGKIAHEIIPEGRNLDYLCEKLQDICREKKEKGIFFGYMPDCDGDRGNIVYIDDEGNSQIIKSQEVFALAIIAEILHAKQNKNVNNLAVVANGPTSMLLEEIAERFGFVVFRAEVGEANVVNLAKAKEQEGYSVRLLGEGSNGGCIISPSVVRDPLCTIFALLKFFLLKLNVSGKPLSSFSQLIQSLPRYQTTPVAEKRAILQICIEHVSSFRKDLQKVFLKEWNERRFSLFEKYDFASYKAFSYVGIETTEVTSDFSQTKEGGFKIVFYNSQGKAVAFIWMRQSGTEPVFRLMADIKSNNEEDEKALLHWEREMVEIAKKGNYRD